MLVAPRALFNSDDKSERPVCPVQSLDENATKNFVGNWTFYEFNKVFSGACIAFVLLVMTIFKFMHATHFSVPNEQLKILRISLVIFFYALVSFISLNEPHAFVYLHPWLDVVQSISLGSFFLLLCEYVSPSESQRDVFFAALTVKDKKSPGGSRNALQWFKTRWILIFQYPIVSLLVAVLTDITEAAGVYCEFETSVHFAKLWLSIAIYVSITMAVLTVIKIYGLLKTHLAQHKPLAKLLAFKLIVSVTFVMNIIFQILQSTGQLNPTDTLTYADLHVGIPNMINCVEMVFFSIFFCYAYSWQPYLLKNQARKLVPPAGGPGVQITPRYQGGPLGMHALLAMLNPGEVIEAIVFAFKMQAESKRGGVYRGNGTLGQSENYDLLHSHPAPVQHEPAPALYQGAYNQAYDQAYGPTVYGEWGPRR
ncbi:hypothetical protein GQ53DRAFT_772909 [Thozetella sp. PMI_491]|nr:hypothetical protein GQ53DRAFT_772909 [Thozetella sp. PMI_491]